MSTVTTAATLAFEISTGPALAELQKLLVGVQALGSDLTAALAASTRNGAAATATGFTELAQAAKTAGVSAGQKFSGGFSVALSDGTKVAFKSVSSDLVKLAESVGAQGKVMHETLAKAGVQTAAQVKQAATEAAAAAKLAAEQIRAMNEAMYRSSGGQHRMLVGTGDVGYLNAQDSLRLMYQQGNSPLQLAAAAEAEKRAQAMKAEAEAAKATALATRELGNAHGQAAVGAGVSHRAHLALNGTMRDGHSAARGLLGSMNQMWLTWGSIAPLLAGAAVGSAISQTLKQGKELEYQLTFVKELAGGAAISFDEFGRAVRGSMFAPQEAAEGMRALAQSGLTAQEALYAIPGILKLAAVGELSVAEAAYGATGVMHAFNLEVTDLGRIGDVFAKAAAVSNTSVRGMVEAMKQASTVGDVYNVTMEETAAVLATMAQRNIEGSAAGTAFRNMMKELAAPTDRAKELIKSMGLEIYTASNELKPFPEMLKELAQSVATLNEKGRVTFLNEMFGERGAKAINALLSDYQKFGDILGQVSDKHANFVNRVVTALEGTVSGKIKSMINELSLSFDKAFEGSSGSIKRTIDTLTDLFKSEEFKSGVQWVTNAVANLTTFIAEHIKAIGGLIAAYAGMKVIGSVTATLMEVQAGTGLAATAVNSLSTAFKGMAAAQSFSALASASMGSLTLATTGFGSALAGTLSSLAAFLASPLGLVVAGVTAVVAGGVYAWSEYARTEREATAAAEAYRANSKGIADALASELVALNRNNDVLRERIRLQREGSNQDLASSNLAVSAASRAESMLKQQVASMRQYKELSEAAQRAGRSLVIEGEVKPFWDATNQQQLDAMVVSLGKASTDLVKVKSESEGIKKALGESDFLNLQKTFETEVVALRERLKQAATKDKKFDIPVNFSASATSMEGLKAEYDRFVKFKQGLEKNLFDDSPVVKKGVSSTIGAEFKSAADEYKRYVSELERGLKTEKELLDVRVKYGSLSQGAAAAIMEVQTTVAQKQMVSKMAETELKLEQQIKAALVEKNYALVVRLKNEKLNLEAKAKELQAEENLRAMKSKLAAEEERAAIERKVVASVSRMEAETALKIEKDRLDIQGKSQRPEDLAFEKAKLATTQDYSKAVEDVRVKLDDATRAYDDLVEAYNSLDLPGDIQMQEELSGQIKEEESNVKALREAYETLRAAVERLGNKRAEAARQATLETQTWSYGAEKAFNHYMGIANDAAKAAEGFFGSAYKGMEDMIYDWLDTGEWSSKKFVDTIEKELKRLAARAIVVEILGVVSGITGISGIAQMLGGGGSGSGSLMNLAGMASGLVEFYSGITGGTGTGMWGAAGNWAGGYGANGMAGWSMYGAQGFGPSVPGYTAAETARMIGGVQNSATGWSLGLAAIPLLAFVLTQWLGSKEGGPKKEGDAFVTMNASGSSVADQWVTGSDWFTGGATPSIPSWQEMGLDGPGEFTDVAVAQYWAAHPEIQPMNDVMAGILQPWTEEVRKSITAFGGDATGMSFGLGLSMDPAGTANTELVGAVADKYGNVVYSQNREIGRGNPEGEIQLELQRMFLAAIDAADINAIFESVVHGVDLAKASAEELNTLMAQVNDAAFLHNYGTEAMDPFTAYADSQQAANRTLMDSYKEQDVAIRELATSHNGSAKATHDIVLLTQARYQTELQLAQQIAEGLKGTSDMFQGSARTVMLDVMDNQQKYDFFDQDAIRTRELLRSAVDPTQISELSKRLNDDIMSAWNTLSAEQKAASSDKFIALLEGGDELAQERYERARQDVIDDRQALHSAIEDAIAVAMTAAAERIAQAAATQPPPVEVHVTVAPPTETIYLQAG